MGIKLSDRAPNSSVRRGFRRRHISLDHKQGERAKGNELLGN